MRKNFIFPVLMCCLIAFMTVSCSDDDNNSLTEEDVMTAYNKIKGSYTGTITCYEVENGNLSTDTIVRDIEWKVDSVWYLTIKDFPSDLASMYITNLTVAQAVAAEGPQDLKCSIAYSSVSPILLYLNPMTLTYNVNYGGKDHVVKIGFYLNSGYSYATYGTSDGKVMVQIVAGGVYVDGSLQDDMLVNSAVPYLLIGDKK